MPDIGLTSFNTGEVSPQIDARSDVEKYAAGCRVLQNMLPLIYGGVVRRPGTEYIATAKNSPQGIRLVSFIYSATIAYMCEFGDQYIRFFYDGAPVYEEDGETEYEVSSPYLLAHLPALQYHQIGDTMWIVHPNYAPRKLIRTSVEGAVTEFSLDTITYEKGPFLTRNDIANDDDVTMTCSVTEEAATGTLTSSAAIFDNDHVGALWALIHTNKDTGISEKISGNTSGADTLEVKGTFQFTTGGTWNATVTLDRSEDDGDTWDVWRTWYGTNDLNISFTDVEEMDNILYRYTVSDYVAGTVKCHLTVNTSTTTGIVRITGITSSTVATIVVVAEVESTDATKRWAEGAWSVHNSYPTAITFFEDRIVYGGTVEQPQTVWFSAVDDYEDFAEGVNDADSFGVTMAMTNDIRWLASLEDIAVGTSGDEWKIASNKLEQPITPTNFTIERQTTHGGAEIQPITVNMSTLFVDYVGRKVREYTYVADRQKYLAPDLTALAEHITEGGIVAIALQRNPDNIIWSVRSDGLLLSLTYERDQNVVAWARHPMGDSAIEETEYTWTTDIPTTNYSQIVVGHGAVGCMLLDQNYQQIVQRKNPPYTLTYHVHQSVDGTFYSGSGPDGDDDVLPVKLDSNFVVVDGWPVSTTGWATGAANFVASVRPSHDGLYVYSVHSWSSGVTVYTKLLASTGLRIWRVNVSNVLSYDIGILGSGNIIVGSYYTDGLGARYPAILSGEDGSIVASYYDGTTDNLTAGGHYRICVVEAIDKWFTCGVRVSGIIAHGIAQAYGLGGTSAFARLWDFDPVSGVTHAVARGVVYKDGYVYVVGDREVYGGGYANVWKLNANTGVCSASADVGSSISLQDILLLGNGTIVLVALTGTDRWFEIDDDLNVTRVIEADVLPVANWQIWRAEAVPEAVLYPGITTTTTVTSYAEGEVLSVAVIPGDDEDEVWLAVLRTLNGESVRTIERMASRTFDTQDDCFFVDCALTYDGEATTSLSGLSHLEGETVAILGDGAAFASQVVSDGAVTLDSEVTKAVVGLPYQYILKPMRVDLGSGGPTSKGSKRKIAEIVVSFMDTLDAQYGASLDELLDINWRTTEVLGSPPELYTGDKRVVFDGGFNEEDPIYISGDGPLPCTVRAIVARIDPTGR